jgi:hypothetical protein
MDQNFVKSVFDYNPETGIFFWKVNKPPHGKIGSIAGYDNGSGYIKLSLNGQKYYAHRVAFLYMTGYMPKEVDHINGVRSDNKWSNLRECSNSENLGNVKNKLGVRKNGNKWEARYGRSNNSIGFFETREEAIKARKDYQIKKIGFDPDLFVGKKKKIIKKNDKYKKNLFNGKTLNFIAKEKNIPQPTLHYRIYKCGMSLDDAINKSKDMTK